MIVLGFVFVSLSVIAAETLKFGYIDLQKTLLTVDEGKKARQKLKDEFDAKQKEFVTKQDSLKKMQEDFEKSKDVLSETARKQKAEEFQRAYFEYQQEAEKAQRDMQEKELKYTNEILKVLRDIAKEIGDEKGYTMILEKTENGVLYAKSGMDLTNIVIERYNKRSIKKK